MLQVTSNSHVDLRKMIWSMFVVLRGMEKQAKSKCNGHLVGNGFIQKIQFSTSVLEHFSVQCSSTIKQ